MNAPIRVLVFPAESENATELHDALSSCVNIEVWGASSVERHGAYVFENYHSGLPSITSSSFYEELADLVKKLRIDVVFPTHDTVVLEFARNKDKIPAKVAVPDIPTAEACRSKKRTYETLQGLSFIPRVYQNPESVSVFPVFAKPDEGQGARGAHIIEHSGQLKVIDFDEYVVTEYLPGREFTIDCLTDKDGILRVVSPRERMRVENGISARAVTSLATPEIRSIAEAINQRMRFQGLWFFQMKEATNGALKLMEVSGRCAGTMCATRAKGYNLPLMTVYTLMGHNLGVIDGGYEVIADRQLSTTYRVGIDFRRLALDYDDTLVMGDKVNLAAVALVYQCKNKGIPVRLITKHDGDLQASIEKHALSLALFDEVVHLAPEDSKVAYLSAELGDVLVDNAFKERDSANKALGIPVFDTSEIPVLLDRGDYAC